MRSDLKYKDIVFCIKDYYHPTRKQEKIFIKGEIYKFHYRRFSETKVIDYGFYENETKYYCYVYKIIKHFQRNSINQSVGEWLEYGLYFKSNDFYEHFVNYDPKIHNL